MELDLNELILPTRKWSVVWQCVGRWQAVPMILGVRLVTPEGDPPGCALAVSLAREGNAHCSLFIVSQVLPRMPDHI